MDDKEKDKGWCQIHLVKDKDKKYDTYQLRYNTGATTEGGNDFKLINVKIDLENLANDLKQETIIL